MSQQPYLPMDWRPDIHPISAPFQGKTPQSIEASKSGAEKAQETRSANISALRQLWREPLTINDVAAITKLPISSVCSLKSALDLEPVDHELIEWGDGRTTKRTRWRLRGERR